MEQLPENVRRFYEERAEVLTGILNEPLRTPIVVMATAHRSTS